MRGGPASAEMVGTILSAEKTAVIVVSDNKKVLLTDAASSTPQLFTGTGTQKRYIGNLVVQIMELVASHWETQELMSLVKAEKAKRIKEKMWEPVAAYSFEPPAGVESVVKVLSPVALVANSPVKRKLSSVIAGSRGDSYNENLFNSSTNALLQSGLAMHLVDLTVHFNIELVVQAITHDAAVSDALRSQIEAMMMTATGIGEFILEISSMSPSLYHQQDEAAAAATTPSNVKSLSPNSSSNKSGRKDANGASAVGTGIVVPAASLHSSSSVS